MKTCLRILALAVVLSAGASLMPSHATAQEVNVSFQLFYDELSPYGSWVNYENYGYVWIPDVDQDFTPYGTNGHWIFTDDGWTWVSDYSWGWAPFHYGRWSFDESYGWMWVPANEWGPAWVTWRRSEGYYGWTPMAPGISIEFTFGGGYRVPSDRWIFVRDRDFNRSDIGNYYVDRTSNVTIINNSTVINNTYVDNSRKTTYVVGPPREEVQRVTAAPVRQIAIQEHATPGQTLANDQLQIYRPRVQASAPNDQKIAPPKVATLKEVTPLSERKRGPERKNDTPPVNVKQPVGQPSNVPPAGERPAGVQPPVVTPIPVNPARQEPVRPPSANPAEPKGRDVMPPHANPSDPRGNQVTPPAAKPAEPKGREATPPAAVPVEPRGNQATPPHANPSDPRGREATPPSARPAEPKGREATPPAAVPVEPRGNQATPPHANPSDPRGREATPPSAKPANPRGRDIAPPAVTPPERKGREPLPPAVTPPGKQQVSRPPADKKNPPKTIVPPDNKRKGRNAEPPQMKKEKPDSLKSSGQ